ncbi:MAG: FtsX-like permease family protein, partial [Actinobacteria bacterium]
AIGWKRRRILAMILGESLLLGVLSIIIGTAIGLLVIQYIFTFPVAKSFFDPDYSPIVFINAIAIGILVSLIGGFYPAYRATRFSPAEALRYE